MPEYATLQFRAKRADVYDWDAQTERSAYRVPKLTSNHVITPRTEQGTRHVIMFGGSTSDELRKHRTEALLKAHGLDPYHVFADYATERPDVVTIEPDKSGFMATITLRLDLCRKAA